MQWSKIGCLGSMVSSYAQSDGVDWCAVASVESVLSLRSRQELHIGACWCQVIRGACLRNIGFGFNVWHTDQSAQVDQSNI